MHLVYVILDGSRYNKWFKSTKFKKKIF